MRELQKQSAIFARYELSLGKEKRLFYLEVIILPEEKKFYLIDYYDWPVTDFDLISEARQQFAEFSVKNI